jgi:hypothetical protein
MIITVEDRIEISDLLANYCFSLDDRDWELFLSLFHSEAVLDFTALGGPRENIGEFIEFLKPFLEQLHSSQHTISTNTLKLDGEYVESRTAAQVMMITKPHDDVEHVAFYGFWYRDKLTKESGRWLIKERVQQYSWNYNIPEM